MNRSIKLCAVVFIGFLFTIGIACQSKVQPTSAKASVSAASPGALAQVKTPEKITMNAKKPGPVIFPHKAHEAIAEKAGKGCVTCHHTSTAAKLKTEKPARCDSCHLNKGDAKNPKVKGKEVWKQEAFHGKCQGCHKAEKKGPLKCMECHKAT